MIRWYLRSTSDDQKIACGWLRESILKLRNRNTKDLNPYCVYGWPERPRWLEHSHLRRGSRGKGRARSSRALLLHFCFSRSCFVLAPLKFIVYKATWCLSKMQFTNATPLLWSIQGFSVTYRELYVTSRVARICFLTISQAHIQSCRTLYFMFLKLQISLVVFSIPCYFY